MKCHQLIPGILKLLLSSEAKLFSTATNQKAYTVGSQTNQHIIILQISEMVSDKQEEVTALEMKLQVLDKDLNWKKEVSNS